MRCERLGLTKVIVTITILYNKDAFDGFIYSKLVPIQLE